MAIQKHAKSNKGRSNTNALVNNLRILLKLLPTYALRLGTQNIQLAATAVRTGLGGLSNGLKHSLGKGITEALEGTTSGADTGLQNAGRNVVNNELPIA